MAPTFSTLLALGLVALAFVAYWRLFVKAGEPGWASLIPIYNVVKLLRISGRSGWWVLGMCVPFLNLFVLIRFGLDLARAFGRSVGFGIGVLLLPLVFIPILAFGSSEYVGRPASA